MDEVDIEYNYFLRGLCLCGGKDTYKKHKRTKRHILYLIKNYYIIYGLKFKM